MKFIKYEHKEDLIDLVDEEIKLIKEHFTQEEINRIDIYKLDGNDPYTCIYGQMTGDCNSKRVSEFIDKNINSVIKVHSNKVNRRSYNYVTPLEEYIFSDASEDYDEIRNRNNYVVNKLKC